MDASISCLRCDFAEDAGRPDPANKIE